MKTVSVRLSDDEVKALEGLAAHGETHYSTLNRIIKEALKSSKPDVQPTPAAPAPAPEKVLHRDLKDVRDIKRSIAQLSRSVMQLSRGVRGVTVSSRRAAEQNAALLKVLEGVIS